ncbi:MAG: M20/M25/M40 family metallo-hydrolase [Oscillospiraceae bacterium]|nr:M20/M25/M40 family metallo-hydrolase [Oscillospiraceae bacterium]MCI7498905.1 M20/M25/M40 family metallo-hydrolase [Oscillospiraceae bacterium]MDD7279758.1 M20/M25/M40 family metallo-hydrolase [Oscillospiraceae bacterium]MDY2863833.1 M20/M25/M40 family metallo-hydrolase [Oscillospiraceae bacterium]
MNTKELTELIMRIADSEGVSGDETATAELCRDELLKYTDDVQIKNGNVIGNFGKRRKNKPHVLLDAHLDRVGLIVTSITEDGFVKADCIGGLDRRIFPAQRVVIHGAEDVCGVICTLPPHLKKDSSVMDKDSIYIDPILRRGAVREKISMGDLISFDSPCTELLNGRICGAGLDDRCGIATIIKAVSDLGGQYDTLPFSFTVLFSTQEEVGERGACIGAFDIDPDISIAVDVSFALCGGEKPNKCGELSKGCMIGTAPSLDRDLSRWIIKRAKEKDIPYQVEVMNGMTGTNADRFSVNKCGSRAVTLSIPLRYMHTPAEVIDVADCELTAELITDFLKAGDNR